MVKKNKNWKSYFLTAALACGAAFAGACGHDSSPVDPGASIDPDAPDEILFQEGLAAYDAQDFATAIAKFDELLATYPDSPRHDNAGYLVGRSEYETNAFDAAIADFTSMLDLHPASTFAGNALYFRGRSNYRLGNADPNGGATQYATAISDFQESIATDDQGTYADNAAYYIGRTDFNLGAFGDAITALDSMQSAYPDSSYVDNAQYYTGRSYFEQGQFADAIAAFDLVLGDSTSSLGDNARYRRGRANYEIPNYTEALSDFEDVSNSYAGSIFEDNAMYYRVRVYVDQADCTNANTVLGTLQSSYPASSYVGRSTSYVTNGGC